MEVFFEGGTGYLLAGSSIFTFTVILVYLFRLEKIVRSESQQIKQNQEALLSVHLLLSGKKPLPQSTSWAAAPDFLMLLVADIVERSPSFIVEAGSGLTTLCMALALARNPTGKILALEHRSQSRAATLDLLSSYGVDQLVDLREAPLVPVLEKKRLYKGRWYDIHPGLFSSGIDLLVVDGPPAVVDPLARYPALVLLYSCLNPGARIFLDDYHRKGEVKIVKAWLKLFPDLHMRYVATSKGLAILEKSGPEAL
ncbi:MAG: class I SAM-dependent methyltransferase [Spirochaetales bacterium]|nr:class I SAM-dependent methyltransferase [Spirochaetales bacterium]